MAMAVKWSVNDITSVVIVDYGGSIEVQQDEDTIELSPTGTSASELIDALIAAVIEAGWDMPDLSRHGYRMAEDDK